MTCVYEKPTWRTCDLAGKDRVFDLDYDVLVVAVRPALDDKKLMLNSGSADILAWDVAPLHVLSAQQLAR